MVARDPVVESARGGAFVREGTPCARTGIGVPARRPQGALSMLSGDGKNDDDPTWEVPQITFHLEHLASYNPSE
jgi:hypothetical protein